MSDDEDECQLQIDESPSSDEKPVTHVFLDVAVVGSPINEDYRKPDPFIAEKSGETTKEDGEIDDDDEDMEREKEEVHSNSDTEMGNNNQTESIGELMDISSESLVVQSHPAVAEQQIEESTASARKSEERVFKREVKKDPKTEEIGKTPKKKKDNRNLANSDKYSEKRKSGVETVAASNAVTPHRSKRASHQMASAAIAACFDDDEHQAQVSAEAMPSNPPSTKRQKKDASTNVSLHKGVDTADISESLMDVQPGSSILVEITVLHRTRDHLAFKLKNGELFGFLSDGRPPMHAAIAKKKQALMGNGEEPSRENRSGSVGSNGRSIRGGSQIREVASGKNDKRAKGSDSRRKLNNSKEEDEEIDVCGDEMTSKEPELREVNTATMHDCHYDGCEKRFYLSTELEYHILNSHKRKVVMYESICCQTDAAQREKCDKSTDIDDLLVASTPMPVLNKETPNKISNERIASPQYSDLSDDDEPEKIVQSASAKQPPAAPTPLKPAPLSAAATLRGIAAHNSNPSSSSSVIGINTSAPPSIDVRLPPHIQHVPQQPPQQPQAQQQLQSRSTPTPQQPKQQYPRTPFMAHSPRQNPQGMLPTTPNVIPPGHPMQFLPGFPNVMHPGMMGVGMDPRSTPITRAPSRQDAAGHKIHELAKSKESQATPDRAGPSTPKVAQSPSTSVASQQQQQQQQQNRAAVNFLQQQLMQQGLPQQQAALMQFQQMQMAARQMIPPMSQNDMLLFQMMNPMHFSMPQMPPHNPGSSFGNQAHPPK